MTLVDDYLERLGLSREPPSVGALFRLHRAQVERVPYETLWIHLGEQRGLDPETSARLIAGGRGGYCYHLNGALGWLLGELGYDVTRHVGGVHGPDGPTPDVFTNHLVLTVTGLDEQAWYVDTGLGDALHEPLPLTPGTFRQGPFEFTLARDPGGDWRFSHDARGSFTGMAWHPDTTDMGAFADRHRHLSTSPESGFVRVLTMQRRDGDAIDILRDLTYTRITSGGATTHTVETEADWHALFGDVFGIDVHTLPAGALADLWPRRSAAHAAWVEARAPAGPAD